MLLGLPKPRLVLSSVPGCCGPPPTLLGEGLGGSLPPPSAAHVSPSPVPQLRVSQRRTGSNSRCWCDAINKEGGRGDGAGGMPGPPKHKQMFSLLAGLGCTQPQLGVGGRSGAQRCPWTAKHPQDLQKGV